MLRMTFSKILPHYQQLLAKTTSLQDLLSTNYVCAFEQTNDYDRIKRNYPWIEFIGLVGFDTNRHEFVILKPETPGENITNEELSEREQEVLQLVAQGFTNPEIARKLAIAENTVKTHLQKIFAKLKVKTRTEAALDAVRRGWLTA